MRLLNLCAFPIIIASPEAPPLRPYTDPDHATRVIASPTASKDVQAVAKSVGYPYVNDALDALSPSDDRGVVYNIGVEIPTESDTSELWACRVGMWSPPDKIVNFPEIPDDVQGVVVPLAVAEAMRHLGQKVRYGVLVFTPMKLKEGLNKEGDMMKVYTPGLLLHDDLTERKPEVTEREASVAHSTYL